MVPRVHYISVEGECQTEYRFLKRTAHNNNLAWQSFNYPQKPTGLFGILLKGYEASSCYYILISQQSWSFSPLTCINGLDIHVCVLIKFGNKQFTGDTRALP